MSVSRISQLGLATLLMISTGIAAAEEKAPTLEEAKAAFAKADHSLNEAWTAAKKALRETEFAELQIKQREWVQFRESQARAETRAQGEAEAKKSASYFETAAELTKSRAQWLRGRIKDEAETLTGLWIDSFGGTLEIVQEKERLLFVFSVVRGPTFHTGALAGVATWNTPLGWFSDKGRDKEKPEETNIVFVQRQNELEVTGANTSYYHGARAYFDGTYCMIAPLDDKQKAVVKKAAESGAVPEE